MSDVDAILKQGLAAHQAGRFTEAADSYAQAFQRDPKNFNALNLLGMLHHQQGNHERGEDLIRAAIQLAPTIAGFHNNLGNTLLAQRRIEPAEESYRRAIALQGDYAEARNNLGVVLLGRGRISDAIEQFHQAIALNPAYPSARNNLGNALRAKSLNADAVASYRVAVALKPDFAQAHANMAIALFGMDKTEEAIAACQRAIALRPDDSSANLTVGMILEQIGQRQQAIECYRAALRLRPDSRQLRFQLAALTGEDKFEVAPPEYVTSVFDNYAERFDRHLTKTLKYRAPGMIVDALDRAGVARDGEVVDLGCGTGLCGTLLRPRARRMTGVDLSSHMLGRAYERKVYDELFVDEIVAFLSLRFAQFDLAVAADVLIYFGELRPLLAGAGQALKPGGAIAFTVEKQDGDGYALRPTRRYAHSIEYIRSVANTVGLTEVSAAEGVVRIENQEDVAGWTVILRRPASR